MADHNNTDERVEKLVRIADLVRALIQPEPDPEIRAILTAALTLIDQATIMCCCPEAGTRGDFYEALRAATTAGKAALADLRVTDEGLTALDEAGQDSGGTA